MHKCINKYFIPHREQEQELENSLPWLRQNAQHDIPSQHSIADRPPLDIAKVNVIA